MTVLVTCANGMFGGAVARALAARGVPVRAMVRDRSRFAFVHPAVEVVEGDLDRPGTLPPVLRGADAVFLATPMDPRLGEREIAVIDAAERAGTRRLVKLGGAVQHGDDPLARLHGAALARLGASSLDWCLASPNSVMETALLPMAPMIRAHGALFGMSGRGRVGLVALADVAEAAAALLLGAGGGDFRLTGPEALDLYQVAAIMSRALGREVAYRDFPEPEFAAMMAAATRMPPQALELGVLCHLRAWRAGCADLVTDDVRRLADRPPTDLETWARERRGDLLGA